MYATRVSFRLVATSDSTCRSGPLPGDAAGMVGPTAGLAPTTPIGSAPRGAQQAKKKHLEVKRVA